jgi:hypothetical protein
MPVREREEIQEVPRVLGRASIAHELTEWAVVFLFVAPFVVSLAAYRMYLRAFTSEVSVYAAALMNALVLSKIIRIGEVAGLGKRFENKPLIVPTVHKAVVFTLFYLAFLAVEEMVHGLRHGQTLLDSFYAGFVVEKEDLLMRGLVTFFAAIPFFALREARRMLGADNFRRLFVGGRPKHADASTGSS